MQQAGYEPPRIGSKWRGENGHLHVILMIANAHETHHERRVSVVYADVTTGECGSAPVADFYARFQETYHWPSIPAATKMADAVLSASDLGIARAMVELLAEDSARLTFLETAIRRNGFQLEWQASGFRLHPVAGSPSLQFSTLREAIDYAAAA